VTTIYVGAYYEVSKTKISAGVVRKYYTFGGQRIALRVSGTPGAGASVENGLYYILSDHLGSTSLVVKSGAPSSAMGLQYKAFGEQQDSSGNLNLTKRQYTGQIKMDTIGLYYYNARWLDPSSREKDRNASCGNP